MADIPRSPKILHISWGRIEVEGLGVGKDFMLYPGGGCEWNWKKTGTQHDPGIQPTDVEKLLEKGASVIVLSRGMASRLKTSPETYRLLEERGIPVHVKDTKEAVDLYNELAKTQAVGGLFHSTC